MNKLIYAIAIAIATTFTANTKTEKESSEFIEKPSIQQIKELPLDSKVDSIKPIL